MAMKVDQGSSVEPRPPQITGNSKMSKLGLKSGFVIPKNKLSGSLVPVFRSAAKVDNDKIKEDSNKPIQRKTKWGTDPTQDATVRKGRALAYQTRVEQITKLLKSGVLDKGDENLSSKSLNEDLSEFSGLEAVDQSKKLEMELEKREAIGEILKLNPSYKAPLDYKPLMKEASVPVPVNLYPGLNFIGLILGPGSNTQKRLEEETGARIRIHGTKAGSAEMVEITSSDKNDVQGSYEELYVHVSADTFEKVDAAVSLIELLVTPVSGNSVLVSTAPSSVSGNITTMLEQGQDNSSSHLMPAPVVNQGAMQSMVSPMQPSFLPQAQFQQYPTPWFPSGPMRPPNNFGPQSNSSAPLLNNVGQFPLSPLNPSNMTQYFVAHPTSPAGPGMAPRNSSLNSPGLQPPPQGFQWPYFHEAPPNSQGPPPRIHSISGSQPHLVYPSFHAQSNPAAPHQGNQPRTTGSGPGQTPNTPLSSYGRSPLTVAPTSQPVVHFQRPHAVSQPLMIPGNASNISGTVRSGPSGNMVSSASFPSQASTAQLPNTLVNRPVTGQNFSFVIHQRSPLAPNPVPPASLASMPPLLPSAGPSSSSGPSHAPSSMMPPSPAFPRVQTPAVAQGATPAPASSLSLNQSSPISHGQPLGPQGPTPNQSMVGSALVPPPLPSSSPQLSVNPNSTPGSLPLLTSPKPSPQNIPATTPKPQRPSSGDFTFKPLGSPLPVSPKNSRPIDQPSQVASAPPPSMVQPPPAPQTQSYRPGSQHVMQGFPSPGQNNQMIQVRPPSLNSSPFPGNQSPMRPPPRFPEFANPNQVASTASAPHMGPRSFTQPPQPSNFSGRFPPQMMNPPQMQQNQPGSAMRPGSFLPPNQHYANNPTFSSGRPASNLSGNQVYDPFSPSSISSTQQPENSTKVRKQEDDPEYDDLMASVGVR